jgi:hypothetical protein
MTDLGFDGWAIEVRSSDEEFEYVDFLKDGERVGTGRWMIGRLDWAELPPALSALAPTDAAELTRRATQLMRASPVKH